MEEHTAPMVRAEDDSDASVKNVGTFLPSYMTSHPDNSNVNIHCCENHKFMHLLKFPFMKGICRVKDLERISFMLF